VGLHVESGAVVLDLKFGSVIWAMSSFIHEHIALRMSVDAETDSFVVEIVDLVKMAQHDVADQEQVA